MINSTVYKGTNMVLRTERYGYTYYIGTCHVGICSMVFLLVADSHKVGSRSAEVTIIQGISLRSSELTVRPMHIRGSINDHNGGGRRSPLLTPPGNLGSLAVLCRYGCSR